MAEIFVMGWKGRWQGSGARKTAKQAMLAAVHAVDSGASGTPELRMSAVEGHGADRLRIAAERLVAEGSEELAGLLMTKAMEGKLESVKMLMKLAEEEKARKVEEKAAQEENPIFKLLGYEKAQPEVGDVWIGNGWKNEVTGEVVKGMWDGWKFDEWKEAA